jgi:hypothetical protein
MSQVEGQQDTARVHQAYGTGNQVLYPGTVREEEVMTVDQFKLHDATIKLMKCKGYTIEDELFDGFIIAYDNMEECLVFADVIDETHEEKMEDIRLTRRQFEELALKYMMDHDVPEGNLRYDIFSFMIMGKRALVKQMLNVELREEQ